MAKPPKSKLQAKWNRVWKKLNDNRKMYYHTFKIVILRNKGLIFAFLAQIILISYSIILLTTSKVQTISIGRFHCKSPKISENPAKPLPKSNLSTSNVKMGTTSCLEEEVGSINFRYKTSFIDLTYFYSEFSPYNNNSNEEISLEEIKALEEADISQSGNPRVNKKFPYKKNQVKGFNNTEKYIIEFNYSQCFKEIAIAGQSREIDSNGCDLYVIGNLLFIQTILMLFFSLLTLIGLIIYSRSLFLWSQKHKFTMAFSFVTVFLVGVNIFLLWLFRNEIETNLGKFSDIFNGYMATRKDSKFLGLTFIEYSFIFGIIQIINVFIVMKFYTEMTPEKKSYRNTYEFLMNEKRYSESVSSVTETTDFITNEIY